MATGINVQHERHRFAMLLDGERALLQRFIGVLEQEEKLLISGDTDALFQLTQEKSEVYHLLQRQHQERGQILARLRLPNNNDSIQRLCTGMPDTLERWSQILELAEQARQRNELNGKLITERMHHNQAALSVLLNAANKPQLYDAAGSARPTGGGRILGSA